MSKYSYDLYRDGVTQTFLNKFMECREQCRLGYIEGWRATGEGDATLFGSASHFVMSEGSEASKKWRKSSPALSPEVIGNRLARTVPLFTKRFERGWKDENPRATVRMTEQLERCLGLVEAVLPHYFQRCLAPDRLYGDFARRNWISLEEKFAIPFTFKDGRKTVLRGRMDGVYEETNRVWLFESKNLTRIDGEGISDTLPMNLQVCMYLHALSEQQKATKDMRKLGGVLYNIVRRPALRMATKDTLDSFLKRVDLDVKSRPDHYFMRFRMPITVSEMQEWYAKNFMPMMHDVQRWYDDIRETGGENFNYLNASALIGKYGRCGLFDAITKNDFSGCVKKSVPFSELVDE